MTYKETLFFIGKCLTISHEVENRNAIEGVLKAGTVDWDSVVKVSTGHFVFPALYLNLQRADFLGYVPEDLVGYMEHITDLNRERNEQIVAQAKEINELLLANGITPIFLKGTGNLLEGLYEDLGERMVGDIDFIFSKDEYPKAIEVLTDLGGYEFVEKSDYHFPNFKHYPRIQKEGYIAAVEIHKELLVEKYASEFNYGLIRKNTQRFGAVTVMSFQNQFCLSIIAKQINDGGMYFKDISLRNGYDVFLLSKKTAVATAFDGLPMLKFPLSCFVASCAEVFGKPTSLEVERTKEIEDYLSTFYALLQNEQLRVSAHRKTSRKLFFKARMGVFFKALLDKKGRTWLLKKFTNKNWQQEKMRQLSLSPQALYPIPQPLSEGKGGMPIPQPLSEGKGG